jgi:hypothetical protein
MIRAADPTCNGAPRPGTRTTESANALEPVLGQQHGQAEVMDQPRQRAQHLFRGRRVEGRRRFVEDEDPG